MQERNNLGVKRPSYVQIEMQQLGSAEPSWPSISRNNAHTCPELKKSSLAIDRDRGTSARILDGTRHIGLLIEPLPGGVLYFQGVLGTAFVDRVPQRSELSRSVWLGLLEPGRASVGAFQNFDNLLASPLNDQSPFAYCCQFFQNRVLVFLFSNVCTPR